MSRPKRLYTIGYEGQPLTAFLQRLCDLDVRTLIDVRELPLSRKRGFSKRALAAALEEYGIAYAHMPALGCPKKIRDRLKQDGNWGRYVRDFKRHLAKQSASLTELIKFAHATTCCLMCFEADFNRCHRSIVARAAVQVGAPRISHITSMATIPDVAHQAAA